MSTSKPARVRRGLSVGRITTVVLTSLLVYVFVQGQDTVAAREINPTPSWQSFASDSATETARGGIGALTTVYALPERVELVFSAPVEFRSASLRGSREQPSRFYVDISPASLSPQRGAVFNINAGPVRRVRLSLFRPGTIRVVLDLREEHEFHVTTLTDPDRLVITPTGAAAIVRQSQSRTVVTGATTEPMSAIQQEKSREKKQAPLLLDIVWQSMLRPWSLMESSLKTSNEESFETNGKLGSAPSEFTPFDNLPQTSSTLPASINPTLSPIADASTDWLWTVACRGEDCSHVTEGMDIVKEAERSRVQTIETQALLAEERPQMEDASQQSAQETFRLGGAMMDQIWLMVMTAGVFLSFLMGVGVVLLWNLRKRGTLTEKSDGWEGRMAYLEEAVNRAGMLNNSFFHSLDVSQKRLETLLTQSDVAERNLRRLLHQSAFAGERSTGRSADSLMTASLLLAEGEDVQQVARALKLPMAQVRLLHELRSYVQEEKPTDSQEKSAADLQNRDAIAAPDVLTSRLNGAAHNGMHFAHNGHQL